MGCSLLTVDARPARSPTLGAGRASRSTLPRWGVLMLKLTRALYRNAEQRFDYELADRHPRVKRERSLGVAHHLQRDVALEARVNSWRREMHNDPEPRQRTTALHARGQDWFTVRPIVEVVRQTQMRARSAVWPRMNFPGSSFHPCRGSISSGVVSAAIEPSTYRSLAQTPQVCCQGHSCIRNMSAAGALLLERQIDRAGAIRRLLAAWSVEPRFWLGRNRQSPVVERLEDRCVAEDHRDDFLSRLEFGFSDGEHAS